MLGELRKARFAPDEVERTLAFERHTWRKPGAEAAAILELFSVAETRYTQLLNQLLEEPAALAHDPVTENRLRRLRDDRAARCRRLAS